MADPIFAVAKSGKDVSVVTDPNDFIFHSNYNNFKIIKELTFDVTVVAGTANQSFTVAHGLPFTPLVRAFANEDSSGRVFLPNFYDVSNWIATLGTISSGITFNYAASDPTNITFNFSSTAGANKTVHIRYFLLEAIAITPGVSVRAKQTGNKVVIAKPGFDARFETNPQNLRFSSDYGTLKYYQKTQSVVTFTDNGLILSGHNTVTHNLGYFPYVEAFVRVYIGSPSGDYEPVPFYGFGSSINYNASIIIKQNTIELYGEETGGTPGVWNFDFLLFIYKNNLKL
jgi:hypothetical protein